MVKKASNFNYQESPFVISRYEPPKEPSISQKRENTRSQIALFYVRGFLVSVIIALFGSGWMLYSGKIVVKDISDILVTISGILSGPLGFIIGYYFKASNAEDR